MTALVTTIITLVLGCTLLLIGCNGFYSLFISKNNYQVSMFGKVLQVAGSIIAIFVGLLFIV